MCIDDCKINLKLIAKTLFSNIFLNFTIFFIFLSISRKAFKSNFYGLECTGIYEKHCMPRCKASWEALIRINGVTNATSSIAWVMFYIPRSTSITCCVCISQRMINLSWIYIISYFFFVWWAITLQWFIFNLYVSSY